MPELPKKRYAILKLTELNSVYKTLFRFIKN